MDIWMAMRGAAALAALIAMLRLILPVARAMRHSIACLRRGRCADEYARTPIDCVLVLGGPERERESRAAELTLHDAEFKQCRLVLVSSGMENIRDEPLYSSLASRVVFDRAAVDTLTNFTLALPHLRAVGARHVAVITADYHMPRAEMLGRLVLCGHAGLCATFISVGVAPSVCETASVPVANCFTSTLPPFVPRTETRFRRWRDAARALVWLVSDFDGRAVALWMHPERGRDHAPARVQHACAEC